MKDSIALIELKKLKIELETKINLLKQKDRKCILVINRSKTGFYYLKIDKQKKERTYISKNDMQTICSLAQDTYEIKVLKYAQKHLAVVDACIKKLENMQDVNCIIDQLPYEIKTLIVSVSLDDEYAKEWQDQEFKRYNKNPDEILKTDRGEYVRSKTELYIANRLNALGIAYHYEKPILIRKVNRYYHPDFTILNKRTKQVFIWEHMGLMNNEQYRESNIDKIELLASEGYFIGKNLVVTFESSEKTISTEYIDKLIRALFL